MIQFNDAFIKFFQTFDEAKLALFAKDRENVSVPDIVLNPFSYVCQQTYSDFDIVLINYKAEIIDCYGNVLKDITSRFGIYGFTDNKGVKQIIFEIAPIRKSFYSDTVFVKLSSTVGAEVYYSTPFYLMDWQQHRQINIDYFNYTDETEFVKRITIYAKQQPYIDETESKTYITSQGLTYSEKPIIPIAKPFFIEMSSELQYTALIYALKSDIVFINGVRMTNKPQVNRGDFIGNTCRFEVDFKAYFNPSEVQEYTPQIIEPFAAIEFSPFGVVSFSNFSYSITFNKNIRFVGDIDSFAALVYKYDTDEFIGTASMDEIQNNVLMGEPATGSELIGYKYYVLVPINNVESIDGEPFEISNKDTWTFTVSAAEYDSNDYSNDYLI